MPAPSSSRRNIEHVGLNMTIVAAIAAWNVVLFFALPLVLLPASIHFGWLILPLTLLSITHWATIHEAIHGSLHPNRRRNDRLGRLLAVLFGAPFNLVRFGHLAHHALNGKEAERPELYDPRKTNGLTFRLVFYVRLLLGLYAAELVSSALCLLPRRVLRPLVRAAFFEGGSERQARKVADRAERQLLEPGRLRASRIDGVLVLATLGLSAFAYGAFWPLLVIALLGRAFLVSVMDNAPHYGGETDDWAQGYDMRAPGPIRALVMNTNLHGAHHRHPNTPWRALPDTFRGEGRSYAGSYLVLPWRQLKGPIPVRDEDRAREPRTTALPS